MNEGYSLLFKHRTPDAGELDHDRQRQKIKEKMPQYYYSFCSCIMPDATADFMGLAEKWFLYYPIDF